MTDSRRTKEEVKEWMRTVVSIYGIGYDRRNDMRRYEDIIHDEEIIPEYWDYVNEIEKEMPPIEGVLSPIFEEGNGQFCVPHTETTEVTVIVGGCASTPIFHSGAGWWGGGGGGGGYADSAGGTNGNSSGGKLPTVTFYTQSETSVKESTSWFRLIRAAMSGVGDRWDDVEDCTLTTEELQYPFRGDRTEKGIAFTLWTKTRVYFPTWDDEGGYTGVASAPRNPNGEITKHIGDV